MHSFLRTLLGAALLTAAATVLAGCESDVEGRIAVAGLSAKCRLNSDCSESLVCVFERCHQECGASRDCPRGARCVRSDQGRNVCQLPGEVGCQDDASCLGQQVCGADAQCRDGCRSDDDCVAEQVCSAATCADPGELGEDGRLPPAAEAPASPPPCDLDSDCAAPLVCRAGRCQAECAGDADCASGERCDAGRCAPATPPACWRNSDCAPGNVCQRGACQPETPLPLSECSYTSDCSEAGQHCVAGTCRCECAQDEDCAVNQACSGGCQCVPNRIIYGSVRVTNDLELAALADVVEIRGQLSIETERDTIMHLPRLRKVTRFYGYGAQAQIVFDALEEVTDSFRCQGDCYADKLREVGGELSYSGEASRVLSLPALETAGNFSLNNSPKLTGLELPKLWRVNSFTLEANSMLTLVNAPVLGELSTLGVNNNTRLGRLSLLLAAPTKSLTISNNPALALVSLPAVTGLEVLYVTQNLNLRGLELSGLVDANAVELSYLPITDVQLGNLKTASVSLRVSHLASPLALSLPALESVGLFTFTGSSRAVSLSAPKLSAVSSMELSGLNALATLDLSSLASVSDNLTIVATNLTELDHLDPSRLGSLTYVGQQLAIYFNTSLPQCVVNSIVAGLSPIGPSSVSNGMNCSCPGSFCQ